MVAVAAQTDLTLNLVTVMACSALLAAALLAYWLMGTRPVYLVDFAVFRSPEEWRVTSATYKACCVGSGVFTAESLDFQARVLLGGVLGGIWGVLNRGAAVAAPAARRPPKITSDRQTDRLQKPLPTPPAHGERSPGHNGLALRPQRHHLIVSMVCGKAQYASYVVVRRSAPLSPFHPL